MTQQQFQKLKSLIQGNAHLIQENAQGITRNYEMVGRSAGPSPRPIDPCRGGPRTAKPRPACRGRGRNRERRAMGPPGTTLRSIRGELRPPLAALPNVREPEFLPHPLSSRQVTQVFEVPLGVPYAPFRRLLGAARRASQWRLCAVLALPAATSMGDEVVPRSFDPLHLADGPAKKRRSIWERLIPEVYRSV